MIYSKSLTYKHIEDLLYCVYYYYIILHNTGGPQCVLKLRTYCNLQPYNRTEVNAHLAII